MAGCHTRDWFKEASPKKSWLTPIEEVETIQICWQWKESISMTSFICSRGPLRFTNDVIFHVTTVNFSPLKTLPKNVALFMDIGETIIATGGFLGTRHLSVSKRFLIWAEWCLAFISSCSPSCGIFQQICSALLVSYLETHDQKSDFSLAQFFGMMLL